jgi:thiamine biosynthesis protein ThiS
MQIRINGEAQQFNDSPLSVTNLLKRLGVDARQVAVERNHDIIPKSQHASTLLCEGDAIELVTFVGGG